MDMPFPKHLTSYQVLTTISNWNVQFENDISFTLNGPLPFFRSVMFNEFEAAAAIGIFLHEVWHSKKNLCE